MHTLWYARSPVPTPLGLAAQLGAFLEEFQDDGIAVYALEESDDPQLRASYFDHHLANSIRQGGSVPAIWARSQGRDTRVIGLNWIDEYQGILTLPRSGIRVPADLRGARLALPHQSASIVPARAGALRGFSVALELAGIAEHQVEFVDLGPQRFGYLRLAAPRRPEDLYEHEVAALLRGDVDAVYVKGATGRRLAAELSAHEVFDVRHHPDPRARANNGAPRPITVDAALLREHPDLVARLLSRIVAVGDWAAAHPLETVGYIARETQSGDAWVRRAYGADVHLHQYTDLEERSIDALEAYKNFLLRHRFIPADFDVRNWIDPEPLHHVLRNRRDRAA
ncbi:nitrate ABC transporter substrate-binding protein [Panacagrimonas perspica]|nr:nitrate ABC transporter substrate-binding protein [Panacagrimonas perspica]